MKITDQIKHLETQLNKINDLSSKKDYAAYDAWHKQTELLLKNIQGKDSDEAREFHSLDGRSSVIAFDDEAENDRRDTEAYLRDLKSAHSLLTGIIEFLKITSDSDEVEPVNTGTLEALHPTIQDKCSGLYLSSDNYAEAVEKGFKVVRDRLRELTKYETGSEAFGKGHLYINGAAAPHVDRDFQEAVKFLSMAIDFFRNEKSHTSDGKIDNPVRAYEYLALSSLAMHLLDDTQIKKEQREKKEKRTKKKEPQSNNTGTRVELDPLQILSLRAFGAMNGYKEMLISHLSGGVSMVHPLGDIADEGIRQELQEANGPELEANLEQLATWGIVSMRWNKNGSPIFKLAKPGYDILKEHPELTSKQG